MVERIDDSTGIYILNKEIVYGYTSDSISGSYFTEFKDISKYAIENTLIKIFTTNPDIIYHKIGYIEADKTLYIYSNKKIDKKIYDDKKKWNCKKTKDYVKELLGEDEDCDYYMSCISLYDLMRVLQNYFINYKQNFHEMWNSIDKMDKILGTTTTLLDKECNYEILNFYRNNYHIKILNYEIDFSSNKITKIDNADSIYYQMTEKLLNISKKIRDILKLIIRKYHILNILLMEKINYYF